MRAFLEANLAAHKQLKTLYVVCQMRSGITEEEALMRFDRRTEILRTKIAESPQTHDYP